MPLFRVHLTRTVDESYDIHFVNQEELISLLLSDLCQQGSPRPQRCAVITDSTLYNLYSSFLEAIRTSFGADSFGVNRCHIFSFEDGEPSKQLDTVAFLHKKLLDHHYDRDSCIITFGGGVVGDVAGFVAATYKRGIPYFSIPTTLLAMVDSSIGGKTGVNVARVKNAVGLFYHPKKVYLCTDFLKTLPPHELLNGSAEIIKCALIRDKDFVAYLKEYAHPFLALEKRILLEVIMRALTIKVSLIEQDPYDKGARKLLNYGHTIGHALESTVHHALSHGQAVAYGMIVEGHISYQLGMLTALDFKEIKECITRYGLPLHLSVFSLKINLLKINSEELCLYIANDKKNVGEMINIVLLKTLGEARLVPLTFSQLEPMLAFALKEVM